jgi:hypothetical protein
MVYRPPYILQQPKLVKEKRWRKHANDLFTHSELQKGIESIEGTEGTRIGGEPCFAVFLPSKKARE